MSELKRANIDDILRGTETPEPVEVIIASEADDDPIDHESPAVTNTPKPKEPEPDNDQDDEPYQDAATNEREPAKEKEEPNIDDYGNPIGKTKMYSEDEVNKMMRERFTRGNHNQQPNQHQQNIIDQKAKEFTPDPANADDWDKQLKEFVKETFNELKDNEKQENWKRQEQENQSKFEEKFSTAAKRYNDFETVVSSTPVTSAMMLGIRSFDNPAAFIYTACKNSPQEIARISKLSDPYAQVVEMGKLEERLRRVKSGTSAPRPLKMVRGDVSSKTVVNKSIDAKIADYGRKKAGLK